MFLCGTSAFCAHITFIKPISFGMIIAAPAGETIEINAKNGPAVPEVYTSGGSHINGGASGIIRVYSDIPGQMISIIYYPVSIVLKAAGAVDITLDGIDARSRTSATSAFASEIDFDVGGLLHINSGQKSQSYSAEIMVTIEIINP